MPTGFGNCVVMLKLRVITYFASTHVSVMFTHVTTEVITLDYACGKSIILVQC